MPANKRNHTHTRAHVASLLVGQEYNTASAVGGGARHSPCAPICVAYRTSTCELKGFDSPDVLCRAGLGGPENFTSRQQGNQLLDSFFRIVLLSILFLYLYEYTVPSRPFFNLKHYTTERVCNHNSKKRLQINMHDACARESTLVCACVCARAWCVFIYVRASACVRRVSIIRK